MDFTRIVQADRAREGLDCERSLRIAAATLCNAATHEVTSTTLVGALDPDGLSAFRVLVAEVADQYGLHAHTTVDTGAFAVQFTRDQLDPSN